MAIQKISRFGDKELKILFELEQKKNFVFTFQDAKKILRTSSASAKNVIKRLKRKKRILRLQKGLYLFAPLRSGEEGFWSEHAFAIVPYLVKSNQYYIGFLSAMNYWGMTEQIPMVVYVILNRQKKQMQAVQTSFIFVKRNKIGKHTKISFGDVKVNISTKEQTIIDGLLFPQYCLGICEIASAIYYLKKELNWKKLIEIAKGEKSVVRRRLGYLLDLLGLKYSKELEEKFVGFAWLDPSSQKRVIAYSKKWGLKLNTPENEILSLMRGY